MRRIAAGLATVLAFTCSIEALHADTLGEAGDVVIGAERLTGLALTHREAEFQAGSTTTDLEADTTSFALLASQSESPFTTPRLALDYFVVESVSIGGHVGYSSWSTEQDLGNTSVEPNSTLFVIGLRGGYAYAFSELLAIWPRLGLSFARTSAEDLLENELSASVFALSGEVMLSITPTEELSILIGPTIDYTLTGQGEYEPTVGDTVDVEGLRVHTYGLHAGIAIVL